MSTSNVVQVVLGVILLSGGLVWLGGCDAAPGREGERQFPSVFSLRIEPDSVHGRDLSAGEERDTIQLHLAAKARDPDGSLDRVVFTLEPVSNPRGTAFGELQPVEGSPHEYARRLAFLLSTTRDAQYTIRVFAVDDDSLASNQVTGQFRYVAPGSTETSARPPMQPSASSSALRSTSTADFLFPRQ